MNGRPHLAAALRDLVIGTLYTLVTLGLSLASFYYGVRHLFSSENGEWMGSGIAWVVASPLLYLVWLCWFLILCICEIHFHAAWFRYQKFPRVTPGDSWHSFLCFHASIMVYMRMRFVHSLPMVSAIAPVPYFRQLVLRAYALTTHLGPGSLVLGWLYDPDLTTVGEGAVIGSGASVLAHSLTTNPDGTMTLVSVPIEIGDRAVIGGGAFIHPGVVIGEDAVIEPSSDVAPMTQVGAGEVWGGVPARFIRMREVFTTPSDMPTARPTSERLGEAEELQLRKIVATALHSPIESISPEFSQRDTAAWDSLAQLGMALALRQQFGIELTNQQSFQLRSMADLRRVIRDQRPEKRCQLQSD